MTIRKSLLLLVTILVVGCGRDEARKAPAPAARPVLANATQSDLAREVDQAERRGTWREVRDRWQGQTLHWTVTRYKALCSSASACNVAAFPIQRPATHGWLPTLSFAAGEYTKLDAGCGGADQCEVEFEGTLSDLVLTAELPVSLRFDRVRVVRAHAS